MSNYVKSTDFAAKDALTTGNPLKLIKGTEINDEFNNLQTSIATKADLSSPAFSGNPTAATQAIGNNSTRLANTAFVQQEISDAEAAIAITGGNISGTALTDVIITDADISGLVAPIAVADGGTGKITVTSGAVLIGNGTSSLNEISPTTSGNIVRTNGTTFSSSPSITLGTAQSGSGTGIDFTSIPSWAKRITLYYTNISTNGSSNYLLQIGSGSLTTSGYSSGAAATANSFSSSTSGFILTVSVAASNTYTGYATINLCNTNAYMCFGNNIASTSVNGSHFNSGSISLAGNIDRIRLTTVNGTDTFDAGAINIIYE